MTRTVPRFRRFRDLDRETVNVDWQVHTTWNDGRAVFGKRGEALWWLRPGHRWARQERPHDLVGRAPLRRPVEPWAPRTARRRGAAGANAPFRQCSLWVDMRILAMTVRAVTAAEGVSGTREYGRRAS